MLFVSLHEVMHGPVRMLSHGEVDSAYHRIVHEVEDAAVRAVDVILDHRINDFIETIFDTILIKLL